MPENQAEKSVDKSPTSETNENKPIVPSGKVLSGADNLFDGKTHIGVAIEVSASGKVAYLIIPDVTAIDRGSPVFITAPIKIEGENLKKFLEDKGFTITHDALRGLLEQTSIGCEAFYFSKKTIKNDKKEDVESSSLLMMFEIKTDKGLIKKLTQDDSLSNLFDINSMMLRVFRCPESERDVLVNYVRSLPRA